MVNLLGETDITKVIEAIRIPLSYAATGALALIGVCAIFFAVYVAFRLAKAEDEGKRKEAKKQLLWSVVAVFAAVAIFMLINTVFKDATFKDRSSSIDTSNPVGSAVSKIMATIFSAVGALVDLAAVAGIFFGIYIGIRLAMAEDEGKRKEAKNQLLWTIIAVISIFVLTTIIDIVVWEVLIQGQLKNAGAMLLKL